MCVAKLLAASSDSGRARWGARRAPSSPKPILAPGLNGVNPLSVPDSAFVPLPAIGIACAVTDDRSIDVRTRVRVRGAYTPANTGQTACVCDCIVLSTVVLLVHSSTHRRDRPRSQNANKEPNAARGTRATTVSGPRTTRPSCVSSRRDSEAAHPARAAQHLWGGCLWPAAVMGGHTWHQRMEACAQRACTRHQRDCGRRAVLRPAIGAH